MRRVAVLLSDAELRLLSEALDSHSYWQLSDERFRRDGYVMDPGSEDAERVAEIEAAKELRDRLDAIDREQECKRCWWVDNDCLVCGATRL